MKKTEMPKKETEIEYVEPETEEPKKAEGKESPKRRSDWQSILVFIIVLALLSGMAYLIYLKVYIPMHQPAATTVTDSYTYRNFQFQKINGLWKTDVQIGNKDMTIWLHNGAREVWRIDILGFLNKSFDNGPVYITFDPEDPDKNMTALAAGELGINVVQGVGREVIAACARNETEPCSTRPIVDCSDSDKSVIFLKEANTTVVEFDQNCIIVMGRGQGLLTATDKLILYWYGIVDKEGKTLTGNPVQVVKSTVPKQ